MNARGIFGRYWSFFSRVIVVDGGEYHYSPRLDLVGGKGMSSGLEKEIKPIEFAVGVPGITEKQFLANGQMG